MPEDRDLLLLVSLVRSRTVAALGTLHAGAPFVSMVPFAVLPAGDAFVIHVSRLAAHTRDMLDDPRVSLLITQAEGEGVPAQALMLRDPRYLLPPYFGPSGWIALDASSRVNAAELRALALESYRHFAAKRMLARLGE